MQINITGPRGCGKTTVAVEIARHLRALGCQVRFVASDSEHLESLSRMERVDLDFTRQAKIVIVDSAEPEDETSVMRSLTHGRLRARRNAKN